MVALTAFSLDRGLAASGACCARRTAGALWQVPACLKMLVASGAACAAWDRRGVPPGLAGCPVDDREKYLARHGAYGVWSAGHTAAKLGSLAALSRVRAAAGYSFGAVLHPASGWKRQGCGAWSSLQPGHPAPPSFRATPTLVKKCAWSLFSSPSIFLSNCRLLSANQTDRLSVISLRTYKGSHHGRRLHDTTRGRVRGRPPHL